MDESPSSLAQWCHHAQRTVPDRLPSFIAHIHLPPTPRIVHTPPKPLPLIARQPKHHLHPAVHTGGFPVFALQGHIQKRLLLRRGAFDDEVEQRRAVEQIDLVVAGKIAGGFRVARRAGELAAADLVGGHDAAEFADLVDAHRFAVAPVFALDDADRCAVGLVAGVEPDVHAAV